MAVRLLTPLDRRRQEIEIARGQQKDSGVDKIAKALGIAGQITGIAANVAGISENIANRKLKAEQATKLAAEAERTKSGVQTEGEFQKTLLGGKFIPGEPDAPGAIGVPVQTASGTETRTLVPAVRQASPEMSELLQLRKQDLEGKISARGEKAAKAKTAEIEQKKSSKQVAERAAKIVSQDVTRALKMIKENPNLATGFIGGVTSFIPGSPSSNLDKMLDSVKGNVSFDRLQAMRNSSPTGGALGQVSERELALLQSTVGTLDTSVGKKNLELNLQRIFNRYQDIIHGKGKGPKRFKVKFQEDQTPKDTVDEMSEKQLDELLGL